MKLAVTVMTRKILCHMRTTKKNLLFITSEQPHAVRHATSQSATHSISSFDWTRTSLSYQWWIKTKLFAAEPTNSHMHNTSNVTGRHRGPKRKLQPGDVFVNSLMFSSPEGHWLQFSIPCAYFVYMVWYCTGQHCSSMYACTYCSLASMRHPLVTVSTILYYTMLQVLKCTNNFNNKFRHHPHTLGYHCAEFCFFHGLHCWASPRRKIAYSITHAAYLTPSGPKLALPNLSKR